MTKPFREMDSELIQKLLEGQENVITPAVAKEQTFLKSVACPSCGGFETEARVNSKRPFVQGLLLANKNLVCLNCGTEFEPHTRVIHKGPTSL